MAPRGCHEPLHAHSVLAQAVADEEDLVELGLECLEVARRRCAEVQVRRGRAWIDAAGQEDSHEGVQWQVVAGDPQAGRGEDAAAPLWTGAAAAGNVVDVTAHVW